MPVSSTVLAKKVMVKSSSHSSASSAALSPRILELQQKIQDEDYINSAIDRIAVIMSRHIVDSKGVTGNNADFLMQ